MGICISDFEKLEEIANDIKNGMTDIQKKEHQQYLENKLKELGYSFKKTDGTYHTPKEIFAKIFNYESGE